MSIFDTGNWVLIGPDPNSGSTAEKGTIHITISRKVITLSPEARQAMGDPSFVEIQIDEETGRITFIGRKTGVEHTIAVRKAKDKRMRIRKPALLTAMMELLILFGSERVVSHIGNDDMPLTGAYFCARGTAFREQDTKDRRCWNKGVRFNLADAYYCQIDLDGMEKAHEAYRRKLEERKNG